ncbi:MAG TPA: hypothetical protein PKM41_08255 [Deltaproteobacteria bacterium]|jgi:hypothetical protein|nr:hypothetical protein [Deltaproteobacteria bacterium]HOI07645.1 hypothetical protein [Deltaproteobacteria bacterium]
MKKNVLLVALIAAVLLAGCRDDSTDDDDTAGSRSLRGVTLDAFTGDVKQCTPSIDDFAFTSESSALNSWTGWKRNNANGVMGKVFNTTLGDYQSIYTHLETLDEHIALVNAFTDSFDDPGSHTIGDDTAKVVTTVSEVNVPFMGWSFREPMSVPVDRVVTVTSGTLTVHMAFRVSGGREVIVEQYTDGNSDAGVFYAIRDGNYLGVWHASVTDTNNGVQFMWDGDMGEGTFRISLSSDAGGNWQVMGGGSVETSGSAMAFMARNDDTGGSDVKYYTSMTLAEFSAGTEKAIFNAGTAPPGGAGALSYITEDSEDCLGFYRVNDFPVSVDDLDWNN